MSLAVLLCCLTANLAMAQKKEPGLEGTWVTDGVTAVEAAKKARQSISGLPEATRIKFKVDEKKGKVSGTITQLNSSKEYEIQDGKLTDKTFTFKSVESTPINFGNSGFGNSGGRGGGSANAAPAAISFKGELTDANTVTLVRLDAEGQPSGVSLVLRRAPK
jgi:hypothetical protein